MSPTLSGSTPPTPLAPSVGRARYAGAPPHGERTLIDVLDTTAATHPEAPALDTEAGVLTYRELCAAVEERAGRLRAAGVGPGDRVGVRVPSGTAELYLSILAVLRCSAAYVPVDADDPEERAATVFQEADVCGIVTADGSLAPGRRGPVAAASRLPLPEDDAWIIFTSGSTGAPKGVAVSHRSAAAFTDAEAALFLRDEPLGPGDRVLAGLSVAFDASCEEMWLAWRHGACLVPAPRSLVRAGHELGPWLIERAVTVVSTVPTLAALWPQESLDRVRLLIVGGEACPPGLVERFAVPGREMWNTYGPTETTVVACAARMTPGEPVRIGLPLDGWELAVVDENDDPVPFGDEGELVIAGVGTGRYLDPAKDAERFRPCAALDSERAYRTGDLVRADEAGLVFTGRADDQVKLGGRRVELGEIDAALGELPGVRGAAAAVRTTPSGSPLLVGYLVPGPGFDRGGARKLLTERLPAALVPVLAEVDDLPTRTSGKVDRDALPWPLPTTGDDGPARTGELHGTAARLAGLWEELLGVRPGADDDFVTMGGTSLTAARMASALREHHPGVSVAGLYRHPVLADMAGHIDSLDTPAEDPAPRRPVRPVGRRTGAAQILVQTVLYGVQGLRILTGLAAADNILGILAPQTWAPHTSWWLIAVAWVLLFSAPGRFAVGAAAARLLTHGIAPGAHPRGGRVHLRLWTAERTVAAFGVPALMGTPWAPWYARALGCRAGRNVALHAMPPVTGLAEFGDGASVEPEADIAGWWIDGETLHVGTVRLGADSRAGHRSMLMPGSSLGPRAELTSGACLDGHVPAGQTWVGSPARLDAAAHRVGGPAHPGGIWPEPRAGRSRRWSAAYALSLAGMPLLPLLAAAPALVVTYFLVKGGGSLSSVALRVLLAVPVLTVVTTLSWMLVVALTVRVLNRGIAPGLHPACGGVAWRAWFITRLLNGARRNLFPVYAGLLTPVWLRMLGAKVGRRAELSTVLPLPSLLTVDDGAFLADDTLVAPYELRGGWLRLGTARVGRRAFLGNSGIIGPGRAVPDHGLIGVLSDAPEHSEPGTSWLGRPAMPLPRVATTADAGRTFEPPRRLVLARSAVELCRVLPLMCGLALADVVIIGQQQALITGGPGLAALVGIPLLVVCSLVAGLIATAAKWLLMGRFRTGEHPLWSSFVWRNELYDTFVESLAVPWLAGPFTGTPVLNWWLRTLGVRIGRGVWCDTHWLPEPDLITLGDGATVGRGCVLQTHLFHDRIMRMDTVHLAEGASLGPHGIVLPGTHVGAHTAVAPSSLVMRGEYVPAGTRWAGNPIAGERPAPVAPAPAAEREAAA
ncbi:amino acid adenylation domain-containing protein [Streptomyces sp. AV19]|uniref:Pls/PosA family non-ribosomal peptide synthetase n=1 Tax=Streptomyces sp. AV19 TaxID=2793068 RepID=UPI0018FEE32C|nr:Pls/PosA family non-ribosomal peptide synthetase [Streptomyces sp. AV19]MBH1938192.1 amino acid adenylation domain-containing protein [Streptomyces sp. AV19]MDG4534831.1 amino acid adenylation domain-containing protein [Streptomyces sp. AV19]